MAAASGFARELQDVTAITLREINGQNWRDCAKLRVAPDQKPYVSSNVYSLLQASYDRESRWTPLAIYNEETMVGFVMYGRPQRVLSCLLPVPRQEWAAQLAGGSSNSRRDWSDSLLNRASRLPRSWRAAMKELQDRVCPGLAAHQCVTPRRKQPPCSFVSSVQSGAKTRQTDCSADWIGERPIDPT